MTNPYFQVARSYLRSFLSVKQSLFFWFILFFFAQIFFISVFIDKYVFPQTYLFPFIALFAFWAIHVKEQFAEARASLTPGFRKVHGVVATIAAIVFVILLPAVTAPLIGWQSLGFVSISTFLFGIVLWYILRPSYTFFFFMGGGIIFIIQKPIYNGIEKIVSGNEPIQASIIISLGAILSITGIIRLFLLNEEKPEYQLNLKFPIDGRTQLSDFQWQKLKKSYSRGLQRWFINRTVVKMIYHSRHAIDSYWSGVQRWNSSGLSVWSALYYATIIYLILTLFNFFNGTTPRLAIRIYATTMMPVFLLIKQLKVKIGFMAQDLMMPVRRDAYLKQVGMSFAASQFIVWGVFLIVLWIFTPVAKPTPEFLIISIFYSVMIQIWLFGLGVWISSLRSSIMNFLFFIAVIASAMPITHFDAQMTVPRWPLILGALLACLGLLLTWWGYRRWMVADFD